MNELYILYYYTQFHENKSQISNLVILLFDNRISIAYLNMCIIYYQLFEVSTPNGTFQLYRM